VRVVLNDMDDHLWGVQSGGHGAVRHHVNDEELLRRGLVPLVHVCAVRPRQSASCASARRATPLQKRHSSGRVLECWTEGVLAELPEGYVLLTRNQLVHDALLERQRDIELVAAPRKSAQSWCDDRQS